MIIIERFPGCPNLGDITTIKWEEQRAPDVLCGGFPCQDISQAGKQRGIIKGETRSGLWGDFHKAIRILRPRYVIVENVSTLATLGLDIVLSDLAKEGYDAEWCDIRASDFGAPHQRERLFVIAYPTNTESERHRRRSGSERGGAQRSVQPEEQEGSALGCQAQRRSSELPNTNNTGQQEPRRTKPIQEEQLALERHSGWETEPDMGRVVNGITKGLDSYLWRERIKALGNGVVPQIPRWLGERILEKERGRL